MLTNIASEIPVCNIDFIVPQSALGTMKWHEKARRLMKDKNIKQTDLIPVFDVKSRAAISHYLTGIRQPSPKQMKALADKLGCGLDELMSEDGISPIQMKINTIVKAAENAMAQSSHDFTEEEKLSVYRAAFAAGLDRHVTDKQLAAYLTLFVNK